MASEIDICNLALTRLGADSIRSFDEDNKRSRLSQNIYKHVRDLFLEAFEWSFNTAYTQLALLSGVIHPQFDYVYQLPSDCVYARQLIDSGGNISSLVKWEQFGDRIATNIEDAWLRYSKEITSSGSFPLYFVEAVAAQMASDLAPAIVQDKSRYPDLIKIAEHRMLLAREIDAELGVEYRHRDQDPENDSFINP